MFHKHLMKLILPAAMVAGFAFAAPAQAELTKDEVNVMIHDYIMANPQLILDTVNDFQKKSLADKQAESLSRNHEELFNNEKSPILGNPKGDVTIVEFFDYNCHFCKDIFPTLRKLTQDDKGLKVIFKDFPILGPTSEVAAKWALAAQKQGKYFDFHQKMMEHKGVLKNEDIESAAKDLKLNIDEARQFVDGTDSLLQIERNRSLATEMAFNGTPSFVINDEAFSGIPDENELKAKIAEKRKSTAAPAGDKPKDDAGDKKDEEKKD